MSAKSDFNLVIPEQKPLKTESKRFTACGPLVLTVADIEASLIADGCVSPNDPANPLEIVSIKYGTAPKNDTVFDNANGDAEVVANGDAVTYLDSKGDPFNLEGGEGGFVSVCVVDENCDLIPDTTVADAESWDIPAGSCEQFAITYA